MAPSGMTLTPDPSPCCRCDSLVNRQGRGWGGFLGGKGELRSPFPPNLSTQWARYPHGGFEAAVAWEESPRERGELRSPLSLKPSLHSILRCRMSGGRRIPLDSPNPSSPSTRRVIASGECSVGRDLRIVWGAKLPLPTNHRSARSRPASRSGGTFREDGVRAYERGGSFARPSLWKNPSPPPAKHARRHGAMQAGGGAGVGVEKCPRRQRGGKDES